MPDDTGIGVTLHARGKLVLLAILAAVLSIGLVALVQFGPWRRTKAAPAISETKPIESAPSPSASAAPPQPRPAPSQQPGRTAKRPPLPAAAEAPVSVQASPPPTQQAPAAQVAPAPQAAPPSTTAPQFPWPPPAASAAEVVPARLLASSVRLERLGGVDTVLTAALEINGYNERSYFAVPQGFAMVTRLEQIAADGSPRPPPGRWSANPPRLADGFSLRSYLRSLFTADPGYYRVIAFIVTDVPFTQSEKSITTIEAEEWLRSGLNFLPEWIGTQIYTPQVVCTALIYEFERQPNRDPNVLLPSRLDARTHLVRSGLWNAIGGG